jgi:DNA-binding Lrp family transcriptional regulator
MGRPQLSQPPLPVEYVRDALQVRQDGQLIWRERPAGHFPHRVDDAARFNNQRAGGPAGFAGPDGRLMVRLQYQGATRRIAATRVAWALATGEWTRGLVRARNGVDDDLRPENLIVVKRGANPFAVGKSSLRRRAEVDSTLLKTLAEHPGSTLPQLSHLVGATTSCCCTRLGRLEKRGLTCSPKCQARLRWDLTERGRALATTERPLIDDLDRRVLAALAVTAMGTLKLARRVEVCPMTIKRRVRLLVERGLVLSDPRRFFAITDEGRRALGADTSPRPAPWVRREAVAASLAKDVVARNGHQPDDRSAEFRSKIASMGAQGSMATARLRKVGIGQLAPAALDRMAG